MGAVELEVRMNPVLMFWIGVGLMALGIVGAAAGGGLVTGLPVLAGAALMIYASVEAQRHP